MNLTRLFKKLTFWILAAGSATGLAVSGWLFLVSSNLPEVGFLSDPGVSFRLEVPDWQGRTFPFTVGPRNPDWVPLVEIPEYLQRAVLAGEDFSFYSHNGVDWYELYESFRRNLRERRIARGASTITQQLAKNLFLTREKSIQRKVKDLILARRLENTLTKDRILELYLNVVELGDRVYGVGAGARHHFGRKPGELSLRESAFLAAMLPGPKVYDPRRNPDRVMNRSDHLLAVMLKGRWITEEEYLAALNEVPFQQQPLESGGSGQVMDVQTEAPAEAGEEPQVMEPAVDPAPREPGEILIPGPDEGIVEIPVGGQR